MNDPSSSQKQNEGVLGEVLVNQRVLSAVVVEVNICVIFVVNSLHTQ
jgi:hypothetical protein